MQDQLIMLHNVKMLIIHILHLKIIKYHYLLVHILNMTFVMLGCLDNFVQQHVILHFGIKIIIKLGIIITTIIIIDVSNAEKLYRLGNNYFRNS
eukprot:UN10219